MAQTNITLSVIIPVFNEQNNISILIDKLLPVLAGLSVEYEIILVDDGSSDTTWAQIAVLAERYGTIKGVALSRNFGHQHALLAGLQHAGGQAIVSMDGDLQHPPEVIVKLLAAWRQGYKVVNTIRSDAAVAGYFKRLTSKYFYRVFSILADVPMAQGSSDFRLIDRQVLEQIRFFNDVDLFLRGAVQWLGFPATTVCFETKNRFSGKSKYSFFRMLKFAAGAIISFSVKPLYMGIWLGVITSGLAFLELIYVLVQYMLGMTVSGWASIAGLISILFGILFIILGIISVYLSRIHQSLQNRPKYVIDKTINF
jgi:dolichol-phosphate mannosyltransferase